MAVTDNKIYASFPITKSETDQDGNLVVYGKATSGIVDSDRQIIDPEWSAGALKQWMDTGPNLRVQHQARRDPAGKGIGLELDRDGDGGHWLKALVVEPVAQKLVQHGILRAFSVGISNPVIDRDMTGKAAGGIIKGGELFEVSLVDRPANKECGFTLAKSAGDDEDWGDVGDFDALLFEAESTALVKGEAGAAPDSDDDTTDDDDEDDEDREGREKAYRDRRAAWKAAEPSLMKAAGPTEYLQARAAYQKWLADGEADGVADGAYGTPEGRAQFAAKRKMDPDVGGGVDRDKIPGADFAGRNRSFPIVTPGDVSDAASSLGRAGSGNYSTDQIKENIIRIARRKGDAFVAALPEAWKNPDAKKAKKPAFEGAAEPFDGKDTDGDGKDADKPKKKMPKKTIKAGGKTCPKCGKVYHADSKVAFCKKCGTKLPGGMAKEVDVKDLLEKVASGEITAEQAAAELEKVKRPLPADTKPVGEHREPDGELVEDLEPRAGLPTEPDATPDKQPSSITLSYSAKRMHDVFCSAYHEDAVRAEYPSLKGFADAADEAYWTRELAKATAAGDAVTAVELSGMVFAAQQLKAADPAAVADARAEMHKAFADMYPNTAKPTPTDMTPGKFQRPYLSAGRAPLTATGASPRVPPSTHTPEPEDFQRGLITSGHQAKPPAAKGEGNNPNGYDARGYYGPAARAAAANYMKSQHDRLCGSQPDLCPMAPSASVMPPEQGAGSVPHAASMPQTYSAPGEKAAADSQATLKAIKKMTKQSEKTYKALTKTETVTVKALEGEIKQLREQLDQLGSQPDPDQAPVRGVSRKSAVQEGEAAPVERRSLVDEAQQHLVNEHEQEIAYAMRLTKSGDPGMRQRGEAWLEKLLITPAE